MAVRVAEAPWRAGHGRNPLRGRLSRRLLVWFLVLSLAPLFVSNTVGYVRSQGIVERLVQRYVSVIAEVEARHIRDQVQRHVLGLQAIAAGNEFLAAGAVRLSGGAAGPMGVVADRAALERHLSRKLGELRVFDVLYLQSVAGRVLAATAPLDSQLVAAWAPGLAPPAFERLRPAARVEAPRFRLTAPVLGRAGKTVAFLVGVVGPGRLPVFLEVPERLGGALEGAIVDENGHPLFTSRAGEELDYATPLRTPLLLAPLGAVVRYRSRHGQEVIATSVSVPGLPWRYVAEVPAEDALGPLRQLRRLSIRLEGLLALLVVLAAWFVAAGVIAPVRRLVEATRRVERGDLGVQVEVEEADEIGELEHAFNDMTAELAHAASHVQELHRREIERAQQLATVGELASGIAHEIKNPVVSISNGLDLVRRRVGADESIAPIMEEMGRELARIETAVRDLLAFARPATPTLAPVDANNVVQRAVRLVQPAADHGGVSIQLQLDPALPELRVDEELIRQALVNLIMNAVQATAAGGRILVSTGARAGQVECRVADTGRGIPPENLELIFKPFFTTRHSGTGLGLPITREIAERHGGRIEVKSRLRKGTTFTLILPVGAAEPRAPQESGVEVHV